MPIFYFHVRKEKNYFKLLKMFKMKFRKVTVELGESRPRNLLLDMKGFDVIFILFSENIKPF